MARSPLKSLLTLLTVGIGVGVLIFALSISWSITKMIDRQLESEGIVLMVANADFNDEGEIEPVRPPQFDENLIDILELEVSGLVAASPVVTPFWAEFVAEGTSYRVRSAVAANEHYADVMNLSFLTGAFFTGNDVAAGEKKVVISNALAELIFGSAESAMGKSLQPPSPGGSAGGAGGSGAGGGGAGGGGAGGGQTRRFFTAPTFVVGGVFEDVGDLQRKSYGVGDLIIPFTSIFPQGMNVSILMRFMQSTVVVKIEGVTAGTAEAQIRDVLYRAYGDDVLVHVWEGTPQGQTDFLAEIRQTVNTFALVVNLLGFILLAAASIGILSIMLVEALGRTREIALERALGASKGMIIKEFFTRSAVVSLASAIIGVGLSFILSGPLTSLILPIFEGITAADLAGGIINIQSLLIGVVSALVIGGIFGVFPVFTVLQAGIADSIREA